MVLLLLPATSANFRARSLLRAFPRSMSRLRPTGAAKSGIPDAAPKSATLLPPSDEQQAVVRAVADGNNVIVDSVAGSGKTTTVMHLAHALPNKRMLLLTYNSRLKVRHWPAWTPLHECTSTIVVLQEETRARVTALKLPNLEVHSFHALTQKVTRPGRAHSGPLPPHASFSCLGV